MLVLSRKVGERIVIDDRVTVVVRRVAGNRVSLGIEAPKDVRIVRGELGAPCRREPAACGAGGATAEDETRVAARVAY